MSYIYLPKQVVTSLAKAVECVRNKDILGNIFEMLNHARSFFKNIYPEWVYTKECVGSIDCNCCDYKYCTIIGTKQRCYDCSATLTIIKLPSEFVDSAERYVDSMYDAGTMDELATLTQTFEKQWLSILSV